MMILHTMLRVGDLNRSIDFYTKVLRDHFLPEVADGINHDYVLLKRFESMADSSMVQGKNVVHPVHYKRNVTSVGAVGYSSAGSRGKLRVLLRRWAELQVEPRWANPTWEDGHAHAACYLEEQRALSQRN